MYEMDEAYADAPFLTQSSPIESEMSGMYAPPEFYGPDRHHSFSEGPLEDLKVSPVIEGLDQLDRLKQLERRQLEELKAQANTIPKKLPEWYQWAPFADPAARKKLWQKEQLGKIQATWSDKAEPSTDTEGRLDDSYQVFAYTGPIHCENRHDMDGSWSSKEARHAKFMRSDPSPFDIAKSFNIHFRRPATPAQDDGYIAGVEGELYMTHSVSRIPSTPSLVKTELKIRIPSTPSLGSSGIPTPLEAPLVSPPLKPEDEDILWMRNGAKRPKLSK